MYLSPEGCSIRTCIFLNWSDLNTQDVEMSWRGNSLAGVSLLFSHLDKADRAVENLKKYSNLCSKSHAVNVILSNWTGKVTSLLELYFFPSSLQSWETILHCLCCGLFLEGYCKVGVGNQLIEHVWFWDRNLQWVLNSTTASGTADTTK